MTELKRTSLFPLYKEIGAKTVDFGGWELPVQFTSIKEEHRAVREKAGLFDVSHMGEAEVKGRDAYDFLQSIITNDMAKLEPGKALYTLLCYENGGTLDDLLIYQLDVDHYLLVLNAANTKKDIDWLKKHARDEELIKDMSSYYAQLAVQGPKAEQIVQKLANEDLSNIGFFRFRKNVDLNGVNALVSRTGYTGEDGFEIYCSAEKAPSLWKAILKAGESEGIAPCGLGARDTLRFEARLPLYGQEIDETISPLEAGLGFAVKLQKDSDFVGKEALKKEKESGVKRKMAGVEMLEKGIPRTGYEVLNEKGDIIGRVTSGTQSPTLGKNIGLVLIQTPYTKLDTELYIKIRKKTLKAVVISTPFYKKA
ncbi:glycine cleavage system aminomethyltransferase GcvT [Alteribacillus bidgolensis]|uniref:Aminomethyltransferase n=1 Tax=Alteribacillus bidgolensis TaxID=930129 RepID=A0A1G8BMK4_9BACI|nr:glycine cleavage system aminomethyltransferase GcvT [Alteribacillus bidgolensis]SDH34445.1 aminomethyltransferase [Alteribacillus bidgolensis]